MIQLDSLDGAFELTDGEKATLKELVAISVGGIIIFTYPKANTPGCELVELIKNAPPSYINKQHKHWHHLCIDTNVELPALPLPLHRCCSHFELLVLYFVFVPVLVSSGRPHSR